MTHRRLDALKKLAGFDKRAEIVEKQKKTVVDEIGDWPYSKCELGST